jgi:1-deoxy-D-xylulose-5-phosphate reductoisomerase
MKRIGIFGSTGSIGTQALQLVRTGRNRLEAVCLACRGNVDLLLRQIEEFRPEAVSVADAQGAQRVRDACPGLTVFEGMDGAARLASEVSYDVMLNALVGISGLRPTAAAIVALAGSGGYIALANKETLVAGGRLITRSAKDAAVPIIPVDSEHSAIFQCLAVGPDGPDGPSALVSPAASKLVLTASGGPFRGRNREELRTVTIAEALKHPNWDMGPKVTVDSATLMNKGLEVIEAKWLFGFCEDRIDVVVHPQSIVHSMVYYRDGAVLAQLGVPDMKIPIAYALSFPERWDIGTAAPDLVALGALTFEHPDMETFKCLRLAREALRRSERLGTDSDTAFLNGAAEMLSCAFTEGRIGFLDVGDMLESLMEGHVPRKAVSVEDILDIDAGARAAAVSLIKNRR